MANIKLFEEKHVRSVWSELEQQWYFSIQDVVAILTDSSNVKDYIKKLRKRDPQLDINWGTICPLVEMLAADGRKRKIQAANVKGVLRIVQSVPSPKAEPFKMWLSQVGFERIQEMENPEMGIQRSRELYKAKGYPEDWIERRMRSIAIREELTDEWKNHGVGEQKEYSILTAEIAKATFGMIPSEHKKLKNLTSQNLRDHMTDLELIFSMLGEAATTEIVQTTDPQGFVENKIAARDGGQIAGDARRKLEKRTNKKVVSPANFLPEKKIKKIE